MTDPKRDEIKARIAAAQARENARGEQSLGQRIEHGAGAAKDKFVDFAKEHPIATVAGGLAVGVLVASMFRGPRKLASKGGARAAGLAAVGSEMALAFASQLMDSAQHAGREGAHKLEELGHAAEKRTRGFRSNAAHRASDLGHTLEERTRGFRNEAAHRAHDASDTAATLGHDIREAIAKAFGRR